MKRKKKNPKSYTDVIYLSKTNSSLINHVRMHVSNVRMVRNSTKSPLYEEDSLVVLFTILRSLNLMVQLLPEQPMLKLRMIHYEITNKVFVDETRATVFYDTSMPNLG